jgi:hypothetical protein
MKTIKDLVPYDIQNKIEEYILSEKFTWNLCQETVANLQLTDSGFQFVHEIVNDGRVYDHNIWPLIHEILENFKEKSGLDIITIIRIKVNLLTKLVLDNNIISNTLHRDIEEVDPATFTSLVYYVNSSDGDTVIGEDCCSPVKGSCVYFNSKLLHRATNPKNNYFRIVVNLVLHTRGM